MVTMSYGIHRTHYSCLPFQINAWIYVEIGRFFICARWPSLILLLLIFTSFVRTNMRNVIWNRQEKKKNKTKHHDLYQRFRWCSVSHTHSDTDRVGHRVCDVSRNISQILTCAVPMLPMLSSLLSAPPSSHCCHHSQIAHFNPKMSFNNNNNSVDMINVVHSLFSLFCRKFCFMFY